MKENMLLYICLCAAVLLIALDGHWRAGLSYLFIGIFSQINADPLAGLLEPATFSMALLGLFLAHLGRSLYKRFKNSHFLPFKECSPVEFIKSSLAFFMCVSFLAAPLAQLGHYHAHDQGLLLMASLFSCAQICWDTFLSKLPLKKLQPREAEVVRLIRTVPSAQQQKSA